MITKQLLRSWLAAFIVGNGTPGLTQTQGAEATLAIVRPTVTVDGQQASSYADHLSREMLIKIGQLDLIDVQDITRLRDVNQFLEDVQKGGANLSAYEDKLGEKIVADRILFVSVLGAQKRFRMAANLTDVKTGKAIGRGYLASGDGQVDVIFDLFERILEQIRQDPVFSGRKTGRGDLGPMPDAAERIFQLALAQEKSEPVLAKDSLERAVVAAPMNLRLLEEGALLARRIGDTKLELKLRQSWQELAASNHPGQAEFTARTVQLKPLLDLLAKAEASSDPRELLAKLLPVLPPSALSYSPSLRKEIERIREEALEKSYDYGTRLHREIRDNNLDRVRLYADAGVSLEAKGKFGGTPLYQAARASAEEIVVFLLQRGVDVNAKNELGDTPLHGALSSYGDLPRSLLELLINHGADINATDNSERTPLIEAIANRRTDAALLLIERNSDVNARDRGGMTPLHWEVGTSQPKEALVHQLLEKGADVNAKDKQGRTPLDSARRDNIRSLLREAGGVSGKE